MNYGHPNHSISQGYYAPTQQPSGSTYGHVYYPASHGGDGGGGTTVDTRNQGISALNNFYHDAQSGAFNPKSFSQVQSRLMAIQAGQFPFLSNGEMSDYQSVATPDGTTGPHIGSYGPTPQYLLPALSNLRTKNDLLEIDRIMEQAQATIYEHPTQMAAAGIGGHAQPGTYHISSGVHFHHSQSPPSVQLRTLHNTGGPSQPQVINAPTTPSRDSPPALTPTGSSKSFTPAQSPASTQSNGRMSPVSTGLIYPTLPSTSSAAMANGYLPSSIAPASTLANQFDGEDLRQFRGNNLQRAQPPRSKKQSNKDDMQEVEDSSDEMDFSNHKMPKTTQALNVSSETGKASEARIRRRSVEISPSMIDPALSAIIHSPSGELDEGDIKASETWVMMARTIEGLRAWIQHRIKNGEFERADEPGRDDESSQTPGLYPDLVTA